MARATTIALIFVATIAICSAQMEETLVEEVNGQVAPGIKMSDINPEEGFLEDSEAKGFKPGSMKKILESIQSLRAYCMLAYDKAVEFKKTSSGNSALVNFITFFGKPVSKKKPMNIVLGFATAIGKAKGTFQSGVNNYLLMHLGKAVFEGKKAVVSRKVSGKSMVRMSAKKMGFTSLPHYFDKLAVSMMKFASTEQEVIEGSSNADAQAAAQWLASGSKAKYKSFKELEEEEVAKKVQSYQDDVYMNALKAIKNSWANSHSLAPLPISGTKAGGKVPAVKVPSPEDVNKAAKKAAEAWQKRHSERKRAAEEKAMKKAQEKAEKKVAEKKAKKEKVDKKKEKEKKKKEEKDAKEKKVKEEEKKVKEEKRAKEESKRKAENDAKEKAKKKKEKKVKETNTKETAAKEEKKEQGMKENAAKEKKKEQGMKEKAAKEEKKEQGMKEKAKKETEKKKEKDTKENAAKEEKKEQDMKEKAKKEKKKEQGMKEKAAKETKKEQGTKENAAKQKERNTKATERKNKAAHRERTSKANERKGKAANTCKKPVVIYQHYHFRGYAKGFHKGRYDMHAMMRAGVKNDDASSAEVPHGCKLIIYQHSRFNGHHATFNCNHGGWCNFDWNHFTRRGVGNDHMSSLRVCNRNGSGC